MENIVETWNVPIFMCFYILISLLEGEFLASEVSMASFIWLCTGYRDLYQEKIDYILSLKWMKKMSVKL